MVASGSVSNNFPPQRKVKTLKDDEDDDIPVIDPQREQRKKNLQETKTKEEAKIKSIDMYYMGLVSFACFLGLLVALVFGERFQNFLIDYPEFFVTGVGSFGFVLLFIVKLIHPAIFKDDEARLWNAVYKTSMKKDSRFKAKPDEVTKMMEEIGMSGTTKEAKQKRTYHQGRV